MTDLNAFPTGQIQPGQRIVEAQLIKEFNVSSIPIREAIRELVAMGMLDCASHRGAWVRKVDMPETIEALQVRTALEKLAIEQGIEAAEENIEELKKLADNIVKSAQKRDFIAFQDYNQQFHLLIVGTSSNKLLLKMWKSLAFEVRTKAIMDYLDVADPVEIAKEHIAIIEAIESRDPQKAGQLVAQHSRSLICHLQAQMKADESQKKSS